MSPKDLRATLDAWAAWIESGRPVPFNAWPPASILHRWQEEHTPVFDSRPLWHGRLKSFWLAEVDRLLQTLPEKRQCILLGLHLPGRATDEARAQELGITIAAVRHARKLADRALQGL